MSDAYTPGTVQCLPLQTAHSSLNGRSFSAIRRSSGTDSSDPAHNKILHADSPGCRHGSDPGICPDTVPAASGMYHSPEASSSMHTYHGGLCDNRPKEAASSPVRRHHPPSALSALPRLRSFFFWSDK